MQDFRDLVVWRKAHDLAVGIYRLSRGFPREEAYGLTSQIRRACTSIPANIAEGCGRSSDLDFARFLHIAMGSACELEYYLLLAQELEYMTEEEAAPFSVNLAEIKKMLSGLIKKLRAAHRDH